MAKEVREGAEVVKTMKTEDDVRVWIMSCELSAERHGVDGVSLGR